MFGIGKKNIFLGVDVGEASIKVVEIKLVNNKPYLSNYAWVKRAVSNAVVRQQMDSFDEETLESLKRVLQVGKFRTNLAHVSMPAFGGMVALIEFPEMSEEDLDQAIKFEAHKYIPTSIEDTALSWEIVDRKTPTSNSGQSAVNANIKNGSMPSANNPAQGDTKMQVLLVAAPKKKVLNYETLIKNAGLELSSIEIESFSLVRSLIGNDQGNFLIMDIGGRICNMILVEKGMIKVNRNIDAGGKDITKTIARSLGVDEARAKSIKISSENLFSKDSNMHFPTFEIIINEAQRVISAYYKNDGKQNIDSIILSGGTAGMVGITEFFSEKLGIQTILGRPFGRIGYDKRLKNKLDDSGSRFSVSVGLALKGVEEFIKK